jgi:protein TonB
MTSGNSPKTPHTKQAWGLSLLVHSVVIGGVAWWLSAHFVPHESSAQPVPMSLAMLVAAQPSAPETVAQVEPTPAEPPVVDAVSEPMSVSESEPKIEPKPENKPEIKPRPKETKPKQPKSKESKLEKLQAKPKIPLPAPPAPPALVSDAPTLTAAEPVSQRAAAVPVVAASLLTAPPSSAVNAQMEAAYGARIRQAVAEHKHYPKLARRLQEEGRVVVAFSVDAQGRLVDVHVKQSSGSERLDEAALQAVRDAAPFPPFPEGVQRAQWSFNLPLSFSLDS